MKSSTIFGVLVAIAVVAFAIYMIDIDQTEEARLPDVEVNVEGGNMPEFEAKTGEIETGTKEVTVEVPTVDIKTPEEAAKDG